MVDASARFAEHAAPVRSGPVFYRPVRGRQPARHTLLVTLYAFNHELARAPGGGARARAGADPAAMVARGGRRERSRAHMRWPVAAGMRPACRRRDCHAADLLAMIDAREQEGEAGDRQRWPPGVPGCCSGPGSLAVAAGRALGAPAGETTGRPARAGRRLRGGWPVLRSVRPFSRARAAACCRPTCWPAYGLSAEQVVADPARSRRSRAGCGGLGGWGRRSARPAGIVRAHLARGAPARRAGPAGPSREAPCRDAGAGDRAGWRAALAVA